MVKIENQKGAITIDPEVFANLAGDAATSCFGVKAMAAQGMGLLGRSPEFKMMLGEMEVASTMHGGFRDAIKWVQPEAMQMLYDYLLDAMTTPPPAKKLFGIL